MHACAWHCRVLMGRCAVVQGGGQCGAKSILAHWLGPCLHKFRGFGRFVYIRHHPSLSGAARACPAQSPFHTAQPCARLGQQRGKGANRGEHINKTHQSDHQPLGGLRGRCREWQNHRHAPLSTRSKPAKHSADCATGRLSPKPRGTPRVSPRLARAARSQRARA